MNNYTIVVTLSDMYTKIKQLLNFFIRVLRKVGIEEVKRREMGERSIFISSEKLKFCHSCLIYIQQYIRYSIVSYK